MNTEMTPRRARRTAALLGGTFATVLALAACGGNSDTPDGAVENFLDNGIEDLVGAMVDGDADKAGEVAEEYFCDDDVASVKEAAGMFAELSEEERKEALEGADDAFADVDDMKYEIGEVNEDGDTATVEVSITAGGETSDETLDMVKEDDAWKICGWMG
ncbi:Rv0361 family membrane protein [Glycomyces tritici]|uniref:DUF4878 domain-containing protein n=1 Tax=Glycomyces tritici TaxID=2665176 RepID=A0ABT7YJY8_9ACTN|nr:nuclear transport factor 2 family protein [Glycomyces tritici]MDN3238946.1 DUF4878 domain-containing protein [Glycomyces tritici]